ncbi:MAG TPA: 30S ribosomal protein S27ae [Candidatus Nitrosotenuis sp.]|nr:30S ribosomal protein S27ae [Candidatus Nitrosotenuis sp.]
MAGKKEAKATGIAAYYKISGDKVTRTHKICSRCGKGVFMSEHKNRRTCGKCGLTEFIQ